jgi:hypothetical protein
MLLPVLQAANPPLHRAHFPYILELLISSTPAFQNFLLAFLLG